MVPTFSAAKSFEKSYVPTEKEAGLSFTSFLDARGNRQLKGNGGARVEKELSWSAISG